MSLLTNRRRFSVGEKQPDIYEGCVTLEFTETTDNHIRTITANSNNVITYLDYIVIDGVEITPTKNYQHTFSVGNHKIGWKFNDSIVYYNTMFPLAPLADSAKDNALVTIPSDITEIKDYAMRGIPAFYPKRGVTCYATIPPIVGVGGIDGWQLNGTGEKYLRVPSGSVDAYKIAEKWSSYAIIAI